MQKPTLIVGSIVVVTVAIAWYLFRPELVVRATAAPPTEGRG